MDAAMPDDGDASGPPRVTDINPPLTPDDPCRQLKMTFEVDVLAADAARLGDLLVVAYQTETGTFVSTYRDEMLENTWPLPAGQPRLFYSRDELHVATSSGFQPLEVLPDVPPRLVMEETLLTNGHLWHVSGTRSTADDLVLMNASVTGSGIDVGQNFYKINDEGRGARIPDQYIYPHSVAADMWLERTGLGVDAYLTSGETLAFGSQLLTRHVFHDIVNDGEPGLSDGGQITATPIPSMQFAKAMAVAMQTRETFVLAVHTVDGTDRVEYYQGEFGSPDIEELPVTESATLATYGASVSAGDGESRRGVFVERLQGDDGLSGSWHVFDPSSGGTVAMARVGVAGVQGNPGALIVVGPNRVMWAGPTIQDGKTPNYPQDAIAVCEMEIK